VHRLKKWLGAPHSGPAEDHVKALGFILILSGCFLLAPVSVLASQAPTGQSKQNIPPHFPLRMRISGDVMQAKLIHQVLPEYPQEAMKKLIKGKVRTRIVIDCGGKVIEVKVLSGKSMLAQAAVAALREWHYQPTMQNQEAVQVLTDVELKFDFQRQNKESSRVLNQVHI
jgi:TonB family protein